MKPIDLKEQKQILLNILVKIDKFCEENNLRYSLGGGTLLGAVRHKGFIPWDDDVDIMMPRPDYDKFVHNFNGYDKDLTCIAYEIDRQYLYPFGKVYQNKTILEEPLTSNKHGIFIDIFPLDGFPSNIPERKRYLKSLYFWRMLLYIKTLKYNGTFERFIKKTIASFIPAPFLQKIIQKKMTKYPFSTSQYRGAVSGIYAEKECYEHSVFEEYTEIQFEGYHFKAIKNYDSYLRQHYGDYMQLPPAEQQISQHTNAAYWLTK